MLHERVMVGDKGFKIQGLSIGKRSIDDRGVRAKTRHRNIHLLCLFPRKPRHERSIDPDKQKKWPLDELLDILRMLEVRRHVVGPPSLGDRVEKSVDVGEV